MSPADPSRVTLSGEARRSLLRLPEKVSAAVVEFVGGPLAANPLRPGKPLSGDLSGLRSARRGDYRVVIRVDVGAYTLARRARGAPGERVSPAVSSAQAGCPP